MKLNSDRRNQCVALLTTTAAYDRTNGPSDRIFGSTAEPPGDRKSADMGADSNYTIEPNFS